MLPQVSNTLWRRWHNEQTNLAPPKKYFYHPGRFSPESNPNSKGNYCSIVVSHWICFVGTTADHCWGLMVQEKDQISHHYTANKLRGNAGLHGTTRFFADDFLRKSAAFWVIPNLGLDIQHTTRTNGDQPGTECQGGNEHRSMPYLEAPGGKPWPKSPIRSRDDSFVIWPDDMCQMYEYRVLVCVLLCIGCRWRCENLQYNFHIFKMQKMWQKLSSILPGLTTLCLLGTGTS